MRRLIIQDLKELNLSAGRGIAVREFPTSTGPVDYALFIDVSRRYNRSQER